MTFFVSIPLANPTELLASVYADFAQELRGRGTPGGAADRSDEEIIAGSGSVDESRPVTASDTSGGRGSLSPEEVERRVARRSAEFYRNLSSRFGAAEGANAVFLVETSLGFAVVLAPKLHLPTFEALTSAESLCRTFGGGRGGPPWPTVSTGRDLGARGIMTSTGLTVEDLVRGAAEASVTPLRFGGEDPTAWEVRPSIPPVDSVATLFLRQLMTRDHF
jgi:hypothetical protein